VSGEARGRALDALATEMASGRLRRGKALKLMAAALVGSTLGSLGFGEPAAAVSDCKRSIGARCKADAGCCSGICDKGTCSGCRSLGGSCTDGSQCCRGNCSEGACACPPGTVRLCNDTCATPCDRQDIGACGGIGSDCGCAAEESASSRTGYCLRFGGGTDIRCSTSCDCPTGQFCHQFAEGGFCATAC
jgi:hypothetical protein